MRINLNLASKGTSNFWLWLQSYSAMKFAIHLIDLSYLPCFLPFRHYPYLYRQPYPRLGNAVLHSCKQTIAVGGRGQLQGLRVRFQLCF